MLGERCAVCVKMKRRAAAVAAAVVVAVVATAAAVAAGQQKGYVDTTRIPGANVCRITLTKPLVYS